MNNRKYEQFNMSRCEAMAQYVIDSYDTVRGTAKVFGVSKSTAHKDLTTRLKVENKALYDKVYIILQQHKEERHIRGGLATRDKYLHLRQDLLNKTQ